MISGSTSDLQSRAGAGVGWYHTLKRSVFSCSEEQPDVLRAFLAVEVPEDVKAIVSDLARQLEGMGLQGLRRVRPDGVHLTLKFLGNVSVDVASSVASEAAPIASAAPVLRLRLAEAGVFPEYGPARVAWVGVDGDTAQLEGLRLRIEAAAEKLGVPGDGRSFTPHLTLARVGSRAPTSERRSLREALGSLSYEPGRTFEAASVVLMSSTLRPAGAVYRQLARFPLRAD